MTYLNRLCPSVKVCHISMKVDVHIKVNNLNILWWSSFQFFVLSYYVSRVSCCDVRYDFLIYTMSGSSLSPVGRVLFTLFVFACAQWCPTHIVLRFCFGFHRLVYPMLQDPLDCSCLSASSVFSNVYSVIFKDKSLNRHNLFIFILQGTSV